MKPTGCSAKADHRRDVVGVGPEQQHFIGGPYRHAAHQRVEHVVVGLVVEQKGRGLFFGHCRLYLKAGALLAPDIEPQVPCAVDQDGQNDVAEQDQARPVNEKVFRVSSEGVRNIQIRIAATAYKTFHGQQIAGKSKKPLEKGPWDAAASQRPAHSSRVSSASRTPGNLRFQI